MFIEGNTFIFIMHKILLRNFVTVYMYISEYDQLKQKYKFQVKTKIEGKWQIFIEYFVMLETNF